MNLEMQVEKLKHDLSWERNKNKDARAVINTQMLKVAKYEWLREQELMLLTTDGVKYLKGEELDKYVDEKMTPEAIDLTEAALNHITKQFNNALAESMLSNKIMWSSQEAIDSFSYNTQGRYLYGNDTREKG